MLALVSYHLVQCGLVGGVEPFGGAGVGTVDGAARCYPEGATGTGTADSATVIDGHWGAVFHHEAFTGISAVSGEYSHRWAVCLDLK